MNDDWRLRVRLHEHGLAHTLAERMDATGLQHELESSFSDRVIVSVEGAELLLYAGTREQAERAKGAIQTHAAEHGWEVEYELLRWHPDAQEWEDPDQPLPSSEDELAGEQARVIEREREESRRLGYPAYEVRVRSSTPEEAVALSQQLRDQGLPNVRRFNFLLIGAPDEASASQLAQRVRELVPDAVVATRMSLRAVADEQPGNPFAVFGGLAG